MQQTARLAADTLAYDTLPDWDEFTTATWAVEDTLDRLAEGAA